MSVTVISGDPQPGSLVTRLAAGIGALLARPEPPVVIEVAALADRLLTGDVPELETVRAASFLVVATPTYHGSYTGALKALFDRLGPAELVGTTALALATASVPSLGEQAADRLVALLRELGAAAPRGLVIDTALLAEPDIVATTAARLPGLLTGEHRTIERDPHPDDRPHRRTRLHRTPERTDREPPPVPVRHPDQH